MPAKEYTVGIPIATVIFLGLVVAAFVTLNQRRPSPEQLRDESTLIVRELRTRLADFIPPNNQDPTTPNLVAQSSQHLTTLRVFGLIPPDQQRALVQTLRDIRAERQTRPITVHFHYPQAVQRDPDSPSVTPSAQEQPEPFRTVRIDAPLDRNDQAAPTPQTPPR